jgi:hypothetical protein
MSGNRTLLDHDGICGRDKLSSGQRHGRPCHRRSPRGFPPSDLQRNSPRRASRRPLSGTTFCDVVHRAECLGRSGWHECFVAESGSDIVGFGACGSQRHEGVRGHGFDAEMGTTYVLKAQQRAGVGKGLMHLMVRWLVGNMRERQCPMLPRATWWSADWGPPKAATLSTWTCIRSSFLPGFRTAGTGIPAAFASGCSPPHSSTDQASGFWVALNRGLLGQVVLARDWSREVPEQCGRQASDDRLGPPVFVGLAGQHLRPALPQQLVGRCILDAHFDFG